MTTNPIVKRFRLRRDLGAAAPGGAAPVNRPTAPAQPATANAAQPTELRRPLPEDDGFGPFGQPEPDMLLSPADEAYQRELTAIRSEGLTGRQLRMARRVAMRHGVNVASDEEAVLKLRRKGIDPFQRQSMLEVINSETPAAAGPAAPVPNPRTESAPTGPLQLPQRVRTTPAPAVPEPPVYDEARRAAEIMRIQRDIARRRRRKLAMLFARLAVFVFLPTLVAGIYYARIATPLYATKSEFLIQQAEPTGGGAGGLGSLFGGTGLATSQDSITVQSYLQSRDAMLRLDQDLGFKAHFSQSFIDPVQRLDADASNEAAYKLFRRNVKIGYDPTEGIIKMEVVAADPVVSQKFSEALIGYAEEQVDQLTHRLREDSMKGARDSYEDAEKKVQAAQDRVLELQQQLGVLDPKSESSVVMGQVATFETQLQEKRLQLQQLLDNAQPNQARVDGVKGDISRLEALIRDLRAQLTQGTEGAASLAIVSGQLQLAEGELMNRRQLLSLALQQMETARIEANRQVRYLSLGVSPVAPDEPTYPRKFENTLLAFLIFTGIYLMLSLTASILREQASA